MKDHKTQTILPTSEEILEEIHSNELLEDYLEKLITDYPVLDGYHTLRNGGGHNRKIYILDTVLLRKAGFNHSEIAVHHKTTKCSIDWLFRKLRQEHDLVFSRPQRPNLSEDHSDDNPATKIDKRWVTNYPENGNVNEWRYWLVGDNWRQAERDRTFYQKHQLMGVGAECEEKLDRELAKQNTSGKKVNTSFNMDDWDGELRSSIDRTLHDFYKMDIDKFEKRYCKTPPKFILMNNKPKNKGVA